MLQTFLVFLKKNSGKTISIASLAFLVSAFTTIDNRYAKAEDVQQIQQQITSQLIQQRIKFLEDKLFELEFKEDDPNENKNLNRALQERYKAELKALRDRLNKTQ